MGEKLQLLLSAEVQSERHGPNLGDQCNHTERNQVSRTREPHRNPGFHRLDLLELLPLHGGLLHANFRNNQGGETGQGSLEHRAFKGHRVFKHHDADVAVSPELHVPLVVHIDLGSHRLGKDNRPISPLLQKADGLVSPDLSCCSVGAVRGNLQHHGGHFVLGSGQILLNHVLGRNDTHPRRGRPEEPSHRPPDGGSERRGAQVGQVDTNHGHVDGGVCAVALLGVACPRLGSILGTCLPLDQYQLLPGLLASAAGHRARVPVREVPQRAVLSNGVRPSRRPRVVTPVVGVLVVVVLLVSRVVLRLLRPGVLHALLVVLLLVLLLGIVGRGQSGVVVGGRHGVLLGRSGALEEHGIARGCPCAPHIGSVINEHRDVARPVVPPHMSSSRKQGGQSKRTHKFQYCEWKVLTTVVS
mmetsp:Transcript_21289/g.51519  ORF Transcript_21289/g.51519 Transcript_21289/m.51519 type:complete len:414 (+) Transcript_21289:474-1715(+)